MESSVAERYRKALSAAMDRDTIQSIGAGLAAECHKASSTGSMENGWTTEHLVDCALLKSVHHTVNRSSLIISVRRPSGRSE